MDSRKLVKKENFLIAPSRAFQLKEPIIFSNQAFRLSFIAANSRKLNLALSLFTLSLDPLIWKGFVTNNIVI